MNKLKIKFFIKKILVFIIFLILPIISFADEIFIPVELWLGGNITELEKIILCDVQNDIYPDLERIFLNVIKESGFPDLKLEKKV